MDINPHLATTLEHIVRQLDILTQTVKLIESRMTSVEEKVEESQPVFRRFFAEQSADKKKGKNANFGENQEDLDKDEEEKIPLQFLDTKENKNSVFTSFIPHLPVDDISPQLAKTLEHIVRQLEILTQTVKIVEHRMNTTDQQVEEMRQKIMSPAIINASAQKNTSGPRKGDFIGGYPQQILNKMENNVAEEQEMDEAEAEAEEEELQQRQQDEIEGQEQDEEIEQQENEENDEEQQQFAEEEEEGEGNVDF